MSIDHNDYKNLEWTVQPEADKFYLDILEQALARCPAGQTFAESLLNRTAIRLRDVVDHIELGGQADAAELQRLGWHHQGNGVWINRRGHFPALIESKHETRIFLRVECATRFLAANWIEAPIEGKAFGPARRALAFRGAGASLGVFERNGYPGFDVPEAADEDIRLARLHLQAFRSRRRQFDTPDAGLRHTEILVDNAVADIGPHWACHLWFVAEREYWASRCSAGRFQKERQDEIGLGWCNIDHHTYDGSRRYFRHTIRILEKLGYELREMLYAGELAGWGSQVMEQPVLGDTIFADVDLSPDELGVDFAHDELPELKVHRRAGLVSALHGESILEAGLNHVAGLYDQKALRQQLTAAGIRMMSPFSDYPHLYQELTEGEIAAVDPGRVSSLEKEGHIDPVSAENIRLEGGVLSHLESIERNFGYKGFNKPGIDSVLRKLDPRNKAASAAEPVS